MLKQKLLFTALTLALLPLGTHSANAEQSFVISGNGDESENKVDTTTSSTTNVNQNNEATINNDIQVEANTGNNSTDSNTGGDNSINTGDISISESITNDVNQSQVYVNNCCNTGGTSIAISENGSGSTNYVNNSASNYNGINVYQNADIYNNVNGYANTGGNSASRNTNGNVSIDTGDISVEESIKNNVNKAKVKLSTNPLTNYLINIFNNGADSENTITLNEDNENILSVTNVADIYNTSFWDLVTGDNTADRNTDGDVDIKTGDIKVVTTIENNVNESEVVVGCDCEEEEPEEEEPTTPPTGGSNPPITTTTTDSKTTSDTKAGEVLSAAIGQILPATGTPWLVLVIFGNLLLLLFGTVLRLRSGRSPGLAYAI